MGQADSLGGPCSGPDRMTVCDVQEAAAVLWG